MLHKFLLKESISRGKCIVTPHRCSTVLSSWWIPSLRILLSKTCMILTFWARPGKITRAQVLQCALDAQNIESEMAPNSLTWMSHGLHVRCTFCCCWEEFTSLLCSCWEIVVYINAWLLHSSTLRRLAHPGFSRTTINAKSDQQQDHAVANAKCCRPSNSAWNLKFLPAWIYNFFPLR